MRTAPRRSPAFPCATSRPCCRRPTGCSLTGCRWRTGWRHATRPFPLDEPRAITLTAAQQAALQAAADLLERRQYGALLLHGVTGSGKTEVYLRVIENALDRGRGAIYLLPEIALTPQTLARITARFGDRAAAIHSGLSAGERCRVHEAAAAGEVRVVVGPRSALFAPVRDLGVLVVDEEHETSYKQDEKPRYHARDAALVRGRDAEAVVVLGSATPDLASWHNAAGGRYRLVGLPDRLGGDLPPVELVDLRGAMPQDGFSEPLIVAVGETLAAGKQAILYHNRRGFARQMQCSDCGTVVMCPHCDIGLTVHLRPRRLLCHYCSFQRETPAACRAGPAGPFPRCPCPAPGPRHHPGPRQPRAHPGRLRRRRGRHPGRDPDGGQGSPFSRRGPRRGPGRR